MPRARAIKGPNLTITITGQQTFLPGDTIIGTISRQSHIVLPQATLSVKFQGRAKVLVTDGLSSNNDVHRSRCNYFDRRPVVEQLHNGPLHIPPEAVEPQTWPFAITIPTEVEEQAYVGLQHGIPRMFLQKDDPEARQLPASFRAGWSNSSSSDFSADTECYVEYSLVATLMGKRGDREYVAVLPIKIRRISTPTPISEFLVKHNQPWPRGVTSYRLHPDSAQGTDLSFKQKTRQLWNSSKVPRLYFNFSSSIASLVQIGNPHTVPFLVRASVVRDRTSESIRDVDPILEVTGFKVTLTEMTTGLALATFDNVEGMAQHKWVLVDWSQSETTGHRRSKSRSRSPSPMRSKDQSERIDATVKDKKSDDNGLLHPDNAEAAPNYEASSSSNLAEEAPPPSANTLLLPLDNAPEPLDLGRAVGLKIPVRTASYNLGPLINPSTKLVTINCRHMLEWKIKLDVGGEEIALSGVHQVQILAPSEDNERGYW